MFGDIIKRLREEKAVRQIDVAKHIGISDRTLGYYENNSRFPNDETVLKKIAEYYDVTIDYLLGKTDEKKCVFVEKKSLPAELQEHIDGLEILKSAYEKGLSKEDIKRLIEFAFEMKKKNP